MINEINDPCEKIFITMRNISNELLVSDFTTQMENISKFSLKGIRINVKDFEDEENYKIIINELLKLKKGNFQVMFDLPYPYSKVRGKLKKSMGMNLNKGDKVYITYLDSLNVLNDKNVIYVSREGFDKLINCDDIIFYGDGKGALKVLDVDNDTICVESISKQTFYSTHSFITKDVLNQEDATGFFDTLNNANHIPDLIALSFVKTKEDVLNFKNKIKFNTKIVSKIETKSALDNIDEIINVSDAIMLARGDLAFAIDLKHFYKTQEEIIKKCNDCNKDLIIATDVLSSLGDRSFPSRSDIIDFQHTFARVNSITLSGSTSYYELENAIRIIKLLA